MINPNDKKIIDKTIADYNLIAAKFSSTRRNVTEDLLDLIKYIEPGSMVLDYGCGNGRMASLFDSDKYLGVDPSKELITLAKHEHPEHRFEIIEPNTMPAEARFDAILCLSAIHHLPSNDTHHDLLNGFYDIISPGGKLILTTWNLSDKPKTSDGLVHLPFKYENGEIDRALYAFTQEEIENVVVDSGFTILESRITPRNKGVYSNIEVIAQK